MPRSCVNIEPTRAKSRALLSSHTNETKERFARTWIFLNWLIRFRSSKIADRVTFAGANLRCHSANRDDGRFIWHKWRLLRAPLCSFFTRCVNLFWKSVYRLVRYLQIVNTKNNARVISGGVAGGWLAQILWYYRLFVFAREIGRLERFIPRRLVNFSDAHACKNAFSREKEGDPL